MTIDTAPYAPPVNIPLRELLRKSKAPRNVTERKQMRAFSKKERQIFTKQNRVI